MTEKELLYFTTIVSTGSYSETALELNISQSAVSNHIQALEAELGVALFDRSGRRVRLTAAGERLLPLAQDVLTRMQRLRRTAERLDPAYRNRITVLTLPVVGLSKFYIRIRSFEAEHPDCAVEVVELEEPALYRRVAAGDYDVAVAFSDPTRLTAGMAFREVFPDELAVVVPCSDPLSEQESVSIEDLQGRPLLSMHRFTTVCRIYEQYFRQHDFSPEITQYGRPETILGTAEAGMGLALSTRLHLEFYRLAHARFLPLRPACPVSFGVLTQRDRRYDGLCQQLIRRLCE